MELEKKRGDILDETIPVNDVLWNFLNSILEEERVSMTVSRSGITFIKSNFINVVPKSQNLFLQWNPRQPLPEFRGTGKNKNDKVIVRSLWIEVSNKDSNQRQTGDS